MPGEVRNGEVSYWYADVGGRSPADRLDGDAEADVVVVGAGYTGLWTAYYLALQRPDLDVRVLEARTVGFGASGRNGGWLTASVTGGLDGYARTHGAPAARRLQLAMNGTIDEVVAVTEREGIDAEVRRGGTLLVARNPAQATRARAHAQHAERWPETGAEVLDAQQARSRIAVDGLLGGVFEPHCARIHPARLVLGLGEAVRRHGVRIHEGTRVLAIEPGRVTTEHGAVRARHVLRCTEGFTADLAGEGRTWLPMNSSMVITEPLPASVWEEIGWQGFETLEDLSHAYTYAQRTPDGRIALGGRGNPYRFGSRTDHDGRIDAATVRALTEILHAWFPATRAHRVAHGWSGVLGVPRNWRATVAHDPETGLGHAGGYVGTGVAATNLAGRTLADLVLGQDTELVSLPWVGQRARRWEPEPLRWLGVHALYRLYHLADRREFASGSPRTSWLARAGDLVSGR